MRKIVKYYKSLIALLLLVITLAGCSDYLSIAPENDLIKEKFWTKREDVEAALAATYDAFRDVALESFIWGELRADLVVFNSSRFADYVSIAGSNINPTNSVINYGKYYNAINLANTLMYFDDEVLKLDQSYTTRMNDAIEAEALFIRSLCYFYLVRVWKDVPLVIEPSITDKGDLFKPKSSEAEIIKQIIEDLLKAKDMAYTTEFIDNPPYYKGRANKYAIMALLSDVYLWNEQYQKSIDYADSIINSGLFSLEPTETWFSMYNPGNSMTESIFEIQFDGNYEGQASPFYNNMIPEKGTPYISFKTNIIETFFNKDDHRWCGTKTPIWKYRGVTYNGSVTRQYPQLDANVIYYRYPDMLLNKAEALNELNKVLEANEYVRLTKERANISHVNILSQTEMRNEILNERGREFIVEGKRWFDILRTAKRNNFKNKQIIINMILSGVDIKMQAILKTRVYDTLSYYLPIPEKDLLYNPNLKQNPFYDR